MLLKGGWRGRGEGAPLLTFLLLLLPLGWTGCSGASESAVRRIALFELTQGRTPLKRAQLAALDLHAQQMIEHWEGVILIEPARIRRSIRKGPRRYRRRCDKPECQVRVGREVAARAALSLWIKSNVLADCEVFGALYDLRVKKGDYRSRARGECEEVAVRRSLSKVVCFLITQGGGPREGKLDTGPKHKECMSLAALLPVERQLTSLREDKISRDPRRRAAQELRLAEQVMELKRRFLEVSVGRRDRWSVSAQCRVGRVYEEYARVMTALYEQGRAPRAVRRLGQEAVAQHREEVTRIVLQKVVPLEQMALKSYTTCLSAADQHQFTSSYILEARTRAQALKRKAKPKS